MEITYEKSGLDLISSYSDDDDDNDKIQTNIIDGPNGSNPDIKLRLPLPSSITQLFKDKPAVNDVPEDDPDHHEGRIRSFPHQRGNWATYVYIPYVSEDGFPELMMRLKMFASQMGVELKTVSDPHISLTRTVVLLHHWIDIFINSVKSKLSHFPSFSMQLCTPAVYCNDDRTRTFLGLRADAGSTYLSEIVHILDKCLEEFRLPPFYKNPSFHMSVLWVVGDFQKTLEALLPQFQAEVDIYLAKHPDLLNICVTQCFCKTGNKMFSIPLVT